MSSRSKIGVPSLLWVAFVALGLVGLPGPAAAEDLPDLTLRYRELTGREEFKFVSGKETATKPVGLLRWEFPPAAFATIGFETAPKTYCIDPLSPVLPGVEYPFRVETFGHPRDFGLKDDEAGRKAADRRTKFVRELYGKYYTEGEKDPISSAAFQAALWELVRETDVPEGPMPFSLFSGTFKADYKNEAEAPAFVQTGQRYVQSLTGDDTAFTDNVVLTPFELVRLTGLPTVGGGAAAQSQLALRLRAGSANITGPFGDSAAGPTGGSGPGLGALLGSPGPRVGGIGGGGGLGGGGAPFFGNTGTTTNPSNGTTTTTPTTPTIVVPPGPPNPQNPDDDNPPDDNPPDDNPPDDNPPNPIPAPPAVVLGVIALAAFGGRKALRRSKTDA